MAKERASTVRHAGLEWMDRNQRRLARYEGQWVAIVAPHGVVAHGDDLRRVSRQAKTKYPTATPLMIHVPRRGQLSHLVV